MQKFEQFVTERDESEDGVEPVQDGETQLDPSDPSPADELINSLKEILEIAKKAIASRGGNGLGDMSKPNMEDDEEPQDVVARPVGDSAASLFGMDK